MTRMFALGFTLDTVYYSGKILKYQKLPPEVSSWALVSSGSNMQRGHKGV